MAYVAARLSGLRELLDDQGNDAQTLSEAPQDQGSGRGVTRVVGRPATVYAIDANAL